MPQRLRRLGSASAAVSAGALVLLLAAPAGAAAAETCKKGTDPASTIENWKCNLGNLRKALTPTPTPTPTPSAKPSTPAKKPSAPKSTAPKKTKAPARGSGGGHSAPPVQGPSGGAPTTMTGGAGLKPYDGKAPSIGADLPGVLPTPEIAADPNAYRTAAGTAAVPQTRLISAVASSDDGDGQMLWVAAAAGVAGAVAALNISVAGRTLRRAAARRR